MKINRQTSAQILYEYANIKTKSSLTVCVCTLFLFYVRASYISSFEYEILFSVQFFSFNLNDEIRKRVKRTQAHSFGETIKVQIKVETGKWQERKTIACLNVNWTTIFSISENFCSYKNSVQQFHFSFANLSHVYIAMRYTQQQFCPNREQRF